MPHREPGIVGSGDRVVFLERTGNGKVMLQAVKAQTGQAVWHVQLAASEQKPDYRDFDFLSYDYSLRANDRTVFFSGLNDKIYAFDIATGEQQLTPIADDINRIEASNETLYKLSYDTLTTLNLATAQDTWSYGKSGATCKQGAIAPNLQMLATATAVYTTCADFQGNWLLSLASSNGQRQWLQRISPFTNSAKYSRRNKLNT
jgi:outer membrane protein assembly factor BamB